MRLMIDTNIFLDVLAEREPFYVHSKAVLDLCVLSPEELLELVLSDGDRESQVE